MAAQNLFDCPVRFVKRKRQRYIRIRVKADEVIVSAPYGTPGKEMEKFLEEKRDWINANLKKLNEKKTLTKRQNRFDEGFLLYEGEWTPIEVIPSRGISSFKLAGSGFITHVSELEHVSKEDIVAHLYANSANKVLRYRFTVLAKEKGFRHGKVTVRSQKTKWGSCSSNGNISLNWRLIKCPRFVQDYIFIHEMCHLVHLNHSPAYWALVDSIYPDRKKAEKWIKENGAVVFQNP